MDKINDTENTKNGNVAADQREPSIKDCDLNNLYRNLKQAEDLFYDLLTENYSVG